MSSQIRSVNTTATQHAHRLFFSVPGKSQEEWERWNAFVGFLKVYRHKLPALEEFRIFHMNWPMHE